MVLSPSLRLDELFLESVLPDSVYCRLVEVLGRGVDRLKVEELRLLNETVRNGTYEYFDLTTELFNQYFVPGVREFERAADVVAQSRESLRACALEPRFAPHPPGRIQPFQFRMAAWYGREAFDGIVARYRAAKDAGQWMKRAESDELIDQFVETVYSVPEESWAAMRAGGQ